MSKAKPTLHAQNREKLDRAYGFCLTRKLILDIGCRNGEWALTALVEGFDFAVVVDQDYREVDALMKWADKHGMKNRIVAFVGEVVPGDDYGSHELVAGETICGPRIGFERIVDYAYRFNLKRPIDLLKIDIEGAEYPCLTDSRTDWMEKVEVINLETHATHHYEPKSGIKTQEALREWFAGHGWALQDSCGNYVRA